MTGQSLCPGQGTWHFMHVCCPSDHVQITFIPCCTDTSKIRMPHQMLPLQAYICNQNVFQVLMKRPQLLRHAAAIACIGAPLPCYLTVLPCSPRYMETSQSPFESGT